MEISLESLSGRDLKYGLSYDEISEITNEFSNCICSSDTSFKKETITFSKNVFLPISTYCRDNCTYCNFKSNDPSLIDPASLDTLLSFAKKTKTKEALLVSGQSPEAHPSIKEELQKRGYQSMADYICSVADYIYSTYEMFSHLNVGLCSSSELSKFKEHIASLGLMLESTSYALLNSVHRDSPNKDPKKRIEFLESVGSFKIPTTTGLLLGIGETWKDRIESLFAIQKIHAKYTTIQEIIIQPYIAKGNVCPSISFSDLASTILLSELIVPTIPIQVPPNITPNFYELLKYGISDLGGISDVTDDYIIPTHPFPSISELKKRITKKGYAFKERLCVYPSYITKDYLSPSLYKAIIDITDENGYVRAEYGCI